jgi:hypothetical protein
MLGAQLEHRDNFTSNLKRILACYLIRGISTVTFKSDDNDVGTVIVVKTIEKLKPKLSCLPLTPAYRQKQSAWTCMHLIG